MISKIEYEKYGAICTLTGNSSLHTVEIAFNSVCVHPDFDRFKFILYDLTGVNYFTFSKEDMIPIAASALGSLFFNKNIQGACISNDPNVKSAIDKYNNLTKRSFGIFASIAEARLWASGL